MLDSAPARRPLPFYAPNAVFERAMTAFKEHGLPDRITTRSLTSFLDKNEAARVASGFASLGWVDEKDRSTDTLRSLVKAFETDSWQETLREVVPRTYHFIPGDWSDLTPEELRKAFVTYTGREADVMVSAETFFLALAHQAGFTLTEKLYRRANRAIIDGNKQKLLREEAEEEAARGGPGHFENAMPKKDGPSSSNAKRTITVIPTWNNWVGLILTLIADLDEHNMTAKERDALFPLLSSLQRRAQEEKETNAA
jgi:hypothetical protein